MADEIDQANELAEMFLNNALANRPKGSGLTPTGFCYNCEAPLEKVKVGRKKVDLKLFCDSDCAEEYEEYLEKKRRSGR